VIALAFGAPPVTVGGHHFLRGTPDRLAEPGAEVYDGEVVVVTGSAMSWVQVTSFGGRRGWLPRRETRTMDGCRPTPIGTWNRGSLECGWTLAARTDTYRTWDYPMSRSPNDPDRRVGTDREIELIDAMAAFWTAYHPDRPLLIGDLSRPYGGPFGRLFGGPGHASHQNGLDVDVFLPRTDGKPKPATRPSQVDLPLARELIGDFGDVDDVKAVFVGCLRDYVSASPKADKLCNGEHENHFHVRLTARPARSPSLSDSPLRSPGASRHPSS
jgi:murein endopeptidase